MLGPYVWEYKNLVNSEISRLPYQLIVAKRKEARTQVGMQSFLATMERMAMNETLVSTFDRPRL